MFLTVIYKEVCSLLVCVVGVGIPGNKILEHVFQTLPPTVVDSNERFIWLLEERKAWTDLINKIMWWLEIKWWLMGRVGNKDGAKLFLPLCTHYFCFFFRNDLKTCFKEAVSEAKGYSSFSLPVCLRVFFFLTFLLNLTFWLLSFISFICFLAFSITTSLICRKSS